MNKINITHPADWYENIFNTYEFKNDNNNQYVYYNIFDKVVLPEDIDSSVFEYYSVPSYMPLTTISYRIYQTMHLWWLILACNNIINPVKLLAPGTVIKVIKQEYIASVLNSLQKK